MREPCSFLSGTDRGKESVMTENGKPVIGIPCSMDGNKVSFGTTYFNSVYLEGAIPVALPYNGTEEDADRFFESGDFDGWLFSGGVDLDPARYGETVLNDSVKISEERDRFEIRLLGRVLSETKAPVLGICRGVQTLNVVAGGTLYQDIPNHRQPDARDVRPEHIVFTGPSRLRDITGSDEYDVNSFHHQSVKDPAPGYVVTSVCPADGVIESIEPAERGRFIIGVQWHPECFHTYEQGSQRLFRAFVDACAEYGRARKA